MESFRAAFFAYESHCNQINQQLKQYQKQMNDSFEESLKEIPSLSNPSKNILNFYESKYKFQAQYEKYNNECRFINIISKKHQL
jgi:hypothetical protein